MSKAHWLEIDDDVAKSVRLFDLAVRLYGAGGYSAPDEIERYKAEAAVQLAMHDGYTALEAAMERILELLGEAKPLGGSFHADLVKRLGRSLSGDRPALLENGLARHVDQIRRFRHVVRQNYDHFDSLAAGHAVAAAKATRDTLPAAFEKFKALIEKRTT